MRQSVGRACGKSFTGNAKAAADVVLRVQLPSTVPVNHQAGASGQKCAQNREATAIFRRKTIQRRLAAHAAGFSLAEMIVVVAVVLIISGMAMVQLQPTFQQNQANAAMDQVLGQLRSAREGAISQRRSIQVQFVGNNKIQLTRVNVPTGTTVLSTIPLQGTAQFTLFTGMPDTPDRFGNAGAIEFAGLVGGPTTMTFQSDGTFVGPAGTPINGTVFLGVPGIVTTARAVTVLGATGRIRGYRGTSAGWLR